MLTHPRRLHNGRIPRAIQAPALVP